MPKIISIANQKGGVGKTTSVINLSCAFALKGERTLICDLDPQAHATLGLGIDKRKISLSIYNCLIDKSKVEEAIIKDVQKNLDILPSSIDLAGGEVEFLNLENRELLLKETLAPILPRYSWVFIDCPPSLGILTIIGLAAADSVLIPIQCEYYALEGVARLLDTINLIKSKINPKFTIEGILLTMYVSRLNLTKQVEQEVRKFFGKLVFNVTIPRSIRLAEAPSFSKSIFQYAKNSSGAKAYLALAEEILNNQNK
jgi:chromosome partitioning protein|uniref:ParA family protein n=1 Tax=candidate division WOR-3 bacterium TaxID=2052148 RepID=A0A7C3UPI5_UNCW3